MFECIETLAPEQARASVIWLHGLGASGDDFLDIIPQLGLPKGVRFVFPHAPVRPVTLNGGMQMPAWFDILGLDRMAHQDEDGIKQSSAQLAAVIDREVASGIEASSIVVMGFSQGGALALYAGLHYPEPLAGIIGLSAYLPLAERIDEADLLHVETPVALAHGEDDDIVLPELGEDTRDYLQSWGYQVDWRTYAMGHQLSWPEIQQISGWLHAMLGV